MKARLEPANLDVATAIERGALRSARAVHRASDNPTIDGVALITRPEQARRVAPRAAVVVAAGPETTSGWLVSSVLRFAWERRASVVVVSGDQPDSVLALAKRLDITLLSTGGDPTTLALNLAADIGAANAAVESQLLDLIRVVIRERSVDGLLRVVTSELGGTPLELEFRGLVVAASGVTDRSGRQRLGPFPVTSTAEDQVSLSAFPLRERAGFNEAALHLVIPYLRAVWFESEASDRLDGLPSAAAVADVSRADGAGSFDAIRSLSAVAAGMGWKDDAPHVVVFLSARSGNPSGAIANVVRLLWRRAMGRRSLAETTDGWFAVLDIGDDANTSTVLRRLRAKASAPLQELNISIGVSGVGTSSARLSDMVAESRVAARCAWASSESWVASFAELKLSSIRYLFDPSDARAIAALVMPEFCAAPDLDRLVETVVSFLNEGSVSSAALALAVHRNTVTARLERVRALGLPVGEPKHAFEVAAVVRALRIETSFTSQHSTLGVPEP